MRKRIIKKSDLLREGYVQGLREGLNVINEMIAEANGEQLDEGVVSNVISGFKSATSKFRGNRTRNDELEAQAEEQDDIARTNKAISSDIDKELTNNPRMRSRERDNKVQAANSADAAYGRARGKASELRSKKSGVFSGVTNAFKTGYNRQKEADAEAAAKKASDKAREGRRAEIHAKHQKVANIVNDIMSNGSDIAKMVIKQLESELA